MDSSDSDEWSDADEEELANSEFTDAGYQIVKFPMECDRLLETEGTPLQRYRPTYLMISDFVQQHWCEMKLLYSLSPEIYLINALPGVETNIEESAICKEVKEKGSDIHVKRELEIQVPVNVPVITREDVWAVKFLNLQTMILAFHSGHLVAREVPVFGMPFGKGLFLYGITDELRYNPQLHTIEISELKTRKSCTSPRKSQQDKDKYQIGLYAQLFNELVQGMVTKDMIASQLSLKMDVPLSDGIQKHIQKLDMKAEAGAYTLGHILSTVLCQMQSFTCIVNGTVEYVHQKTEAKISLMKVQFDFDMVKLEFEQHCEWWQGKRGTTGVEIEDCWKCNYCQFAPLCEWRIAKAEESIRACIK